MKNPPFQDGAVMPAESDLRDGTETTVDSVTVENHEIAALAHRVATARGKLPLQTDPALFAELSEQEIAAERKLAEWIRSQRRRQRRRAVSAELAAEKRDRRVSRALKRIDQADTRWHRRAIAARRRLSNADARLAQLYRRADWSSRALIGVVVLGMLWAGVNVQHNLVPGGEMSNPLYWLSYGFEAMISIPIITIMIVSTTAARWGREIQRGKVVLLEAALLAVTVALNAGPHLTAREPARAAEAAVAPIMVGVVIWLHAWTSTRYASLIDAAGTASAADPVDVIATRGKQIPSGGEAATYAERHVEPGATDTEHPGTNAWHQPSTCASNDPNVAPPTRQNTVIAAPRATYSAQHVTPSPATQMTWKSEIDQSDPTEQARESGQASPATYTEPGFEIGYQTTGTVRSANAHQPYGAAPSTVTAPQAKTGEQFGDAHEDSLAIYSNYKSADARADIRDLAAEVHQRTRARKPIDTVAEVIWLHKSGKGTAAQIARKLRLNFTSVNGWITTAERITAERDAVVVQIRRVQAE